jgi:hypothetical protein
VSPYDVSLTAVTVPSITAALARASQLGIVFLLLLACDGSAPRATRAPSDGAAAGRGGGTLEYLFPTFGEPDPSTFVALSTPLREYMYHRKRAIIRGNTDSLWARYPELRIGAGTANGINAEGLRVAGLRAIHAIDGNVSLEGRERFRVLVSGDTARVAMHGSEGYLWPGFDHETVSELLLELTLVRQGGQWTVVRTHEIGESELHQRLTR